MKLKVIIEELVTDHTLSCIKREHDETIIILQRGAWADIYFFS